MNLLILITLTQVMSIQLSKSEKEIPKKVPIQPKNPSAPKYTLKYATGTIDEESFSLFNSLTELEIVYSSIEKIEPKAFRNLPELRTLLIEKNNGFPKMRKDFFKYIPKLHMLMIANNTDLKIKTGAFSNLKKLRILLVENQKYEKLTEKAFDGLDSLHELSLRSNKIEKIEKDAFEKLSDLTSLYLSKNKLSKFAPKTFENQQNVIELQLQENELGNVNWKQFDRMKSVKYLNIAENKMSELNIRELITAFPSLQSVNILPNKFLCHTELEIKKQMKVLGITEEFYGKKESKCE